MAFMLISFGYALYVSKEEPRKKLLKLVWHND
jgi:hypothetical protein